MSQLHCLDRECPELQQPESGAVTLSGHPAIFGVRAVYTCPAGFNVVGLQSRLCRANGQWTGTEPTCTKNSNYQRDTQFSN